MDIQAFIQLSCGRWFTQRTCHQLGYLSSEAQTAFLCLETLSLEDAKVIAVCKNAAVDPAHALCAARISWQGQGLQPQPSTDGGLLIVPISTTQSRDQGQILQQNSSGSSTLLNFHIDGDQKLIMTGSQDHLILEERIWFASPNLRLRISLLKQGPQLRQATWYSEVRMGALPEPALEELPQAASTQ